MPSGIRCVKCVCSVSSVFGFSHGILMICADFKSPVYSIPPRAHEVCVSHRNAGYLTDLDPRLGVLEIT